MGLGAPKYLASETVRLANVYGLDYKIFASLIYSESSYDTKIRHNHPKVIGLSGWHTGYWKYPDLNRRNPRNQLEAGARTLSTYLQITNGNYRKALWRYKGLGANGLGLRQANLVLRKAKQL